MVATWSEERKSGVVCIFDGVTSSLFNYPLLLFNLVKTSKKKGEK